MSDPYREPALPELRFTSLIHSDDGQMFALSVEGKVYMAMWDDDLTHVAHWEPVPMKVKERE